MQCNYWKRRRCLMLSGKSEKECGVAASACGIYRVVCNVAWTDNMCPMIVLPWAVTVDLLGIHQRQVLFVAGDYGRRLECRPGGEELLP